MFGSAALLGFTELYSELQLLVLLPAHSAIVSVPSHHPHYIVFDHRSRLFFRARPQKKKKKHCTLPV